MISTIAVFIGYAILAVIGIGILLVAAAFYEAALMQGKINRISLEHGSCLSPLTHPSISYGEQGKLIAARREYDERLAELKSEYGEFEGAL